MMLPTPNLKSAAFLLVEETKEEITVARSKNYFKYDYVSHGSHPLLPGFEATISNMITYLIYCY